MTKRSRPRRDSGTTLPGQYERKHGARGLARYIASGQIDGRTWIGRALRDIRLELAADAGGLEHLSARELVLIDRCAAAALICTAIERHVFAREQPIDEAGELLPVLRKGYVTHVASLSRMLQALGLRPDRADSLPSLGEYIASRSNGPADAQTRPQAGAGTAGQADAPTSSHDAAKGSAVQPRTPQGGAQPGTAGAVSVTNGDSADDHT
ncbi:MAG: hypothetical protein AB7K04_11805 [Pseudorhodoplanes sp.]